MPKKFLGTNTKAEASRARKKESKATDKVNKEKDTEDKYWESWESGDRNEAKKKERKEDKEKKRLEQLEKKRVAKLLLEEEESKTKGKITVPSGKVTRSDISEAQEKEAAEKRKITAKKPEKKNVTVNEEHPQENINQVVAETLATEDGVEARNVEEAILVLSVEKKTESHPERRMKAAFAQYEEVRLPELKAENPNMRLSQIKQMLRKEWMKSPENPLNQNYVSYNNKT